MGMLLPPSVIEWLKVRRYHTIFDRFQKSDFPESPIFERLIEPGDTVLDIGANIGLVTKLLWELAGSSGAVHSYEPVPNTFQVLRDNIVRIGAANVTCYPFAISDSDGTATIEIPSFAEMPTKGGDHKGSFGRSRNYYGAFLIRDNPSASDRDRQVVTTRSIDSLFPRGSERISFIKCDAEGFEFECVLGAKTLIEREHPALFIELCSDPEEEGTPTWKMTDFLAGFGYSAYLFEGGTLRLRQRGISKRLPSLHNVDYFYLTPEQYQKAMPGRI